MGRGINSKEVDMREMDFELIPDDDHSRKEKSLSL